MIRAGVIISSWNPLLLREPFRQLEEIDESFVKFSSVGFPYICYTKYYLENFTVIDRRVYTNHMSDKIFKHKIIVETVDKPLKSLQEQLKSINDIFEKQREGIKKAIEAVGNLGNTYKKFEIGKLAIPKFSTALTNISNEGLMNSNKELENDVFQLCVDKNKAIICLEELISVVKGEQEENENSYLGLLFIADTVGKLNLFLTSVLTNKDVSVIGNEK